MSEQAIKYFREHMNSFSPAALEKRLLDAGYEASDVAESRRTAYGGEAGGTIPGAKTSFWNFRDKKAYQNTGEKLADFFFGGFAPALWFILTNIIDDITYSSDISEIFSFVGFIAGIISLFYFWNRRRAISVGLLCSVFITPVFFIFTSALFGVYW